MYSYDPRPFNRVFPDKIQKGNIGEDYKNTRGSFDEIKTWEL